MIIETSSWYGIIFVVFAIFGFICLTTLLIIIFIPEKIKRKRGKIPKDVKEIEALSKKPIKEILDNYEQIKEEKKQ